MRRRLMFSMAAVGMAAVATVAVATLAVGALATVLPTRSSGPLALESSGVEGAAELQNKRGQLLLFNFRAVEPGVLYRGSGFPKNSHLVHKGQTVRSPAAFSDNQLFEFFRARNIRRVVTLRERDEGDAKRMREFYAEQGYFDYWHRRTGYKIAVEAIPVRNGLAYSLNPPVGVEAAARLLATMKARKPGDGAVFVHCDAGKDRTGVAAAAYELWRNRGRADKDTLWSQVIKRFLLSNTLIERDPEARRFSGEKAACGDGTRGFVCRGWLEQVRPHLERLARQ